MWPCRSAGLDMCYVFLVISLPSLTAGSCEGWGERAATDRHFLASRKYLYKTLKEQAGMEAGFVSCCLDGVNTVQSKIRKRGLEHWGLYYIITDVINTHHYFSRVSPSPAPWLFKPMDTFVSCLVSSALQITMGHLTKAQSLYFNITNQCLERICSWALSNPEE